MENPRRSRNEGQSGDDKPMYSRLFVVCDRRHTENQLKKAFSEFGHVEDVFIPRDFNTGKSKGIAYVKFSKTSEAAEALENMNYKTILGSNRTLKILVATNRSDIQTDDQDDEKYRRLFMYVSKSADENELNDHFCQFGFIESIIIQRDRNTGESKGFAYITFQKFSEAAQAFEECDKKYRAVFAQPKYLHRPETSFESNLNTLARTSSNIKTSIVSMMQTPPSNYTRVMYLCSPYLNQGHVERLFDLIPGMMECRHYVDLLRNYGKGIVSFSNPISAAYAVEKLNQFQYPPGQRIFVKPDNSSFESQEKYFTELPNAIDNLKKATEATTKSESPNLAQLAEAIAEASKLIKTATAGVAEANLPESSDLNYCSVKLPPPQPLADIDSPVAKRCFLICKPQPPPLTVLRDIFCRFGNLINVYTLPQKTVGFARYSTVESADEAIKTLHGAEICGVRIRVLEAEEPPDYESSNKRMRMD